MKYTRLAQFWEIFLTAKDLSPLDGDAMPNVLMIDKVAEHYKIQMDGITFYKCARESILRIRERVYQRRKIEAKKLEAQNKRKF